MELGDIEIKEFNKLKQLDRIELLLKMDRLDKKENNSYFYWSSLSNHICLAIIFLMLFSFVMYGAGFKSGLLLLKFVPIFLTIAIFIALIGSAYNSINKIGNKKRRYELKKEYFKTEVKKNKWV
jgi:sterol desaturase/sphingolipid hydroxylase (fatty acid hydroxylase superfamily)